MAIEAELPALSVVMPVYNGERYVAEAIESVLEQTYRDFEFLIINDGSKDGSLAVLETYAGRDIRIRIISRENRGLVASLNEGIAESRAGRIVRMDADDICFPTRFERQVAYMDVHPTCVVLGTGYDLIDEAGRLLVENPSPYCNNADIQRILMTGHCCLTHPTTMISKEALAQVGGYRPEIRHAEDYDLWLRLAEIGEIINLEEPLLRYREHSQAVTSMHGVEQFESTRRAFEEACLRRGVEATFVMSAPHRGGTTPAETAAWLQERNQTKWWWAFEAKRWPTAFVYAGKCIAGRPWSPTPWWLLLKTTVARLAHCIRTK